MTNLLAQIQIAPSGGFSGIPGSKLNPTSSGSNAVSLFTGFISGVIGVMTIVAVIWTVFNIITGAIGIISSGGDKQALETAKKKITTGILGLVIVLVALLLVQLVAYFLGIEDILNIQTLFNLVGGKSDLPAALSRP